MIKDNGLLFEEQLFGCHSQQWQHPLWLDFAHAVAFTELVQASNFSWNTAHPATEHSRRLFDAVYALLPTHDQKRLRFFVAIGTPLDRFHKTDAYFRIEGTARIARIDAKAGKPKVLPQRVADKLKSKPNPRVIIRAQHFDSDAELRIRAEKIVRKLSHEDPRLILPVDEHKLQRLLLWNWKKDESARQRREVMRLKFGEPVQPKPAPKLPKIPYVKPPRQKRPSPQPIKGFATLGDDKAASERIDNLKRILGL